LGVACNSSSSGQTAPNDDNAKQIELTLSKQILTIASPFLAATHCFAVQHRSRALYFGARRTGRGQDMKLPGMKALPPHICRFAIFMFAAGMALPPSLPFQKAKELIREACYNEVQQREKRALWSYVAERHSNNHVFREQVIETVDAPVRHLLAVDGHSPTVAQMKEENDRHQALRNNASRRHAIQKQQGDDDKTMEELLRITPEAFVSRIRARRGSPKE